MLSKLFNTGFSVKLAISAIALVFCFNSVSFGRGALKLYSTGNNPVWNSTSSWSLTPNGIAAQFIPQGNDTVIIDRSITQNCNFIFSGYGVLEVLTTGILRGDNFDLGFSGNSKLVCKGELKVNNLNLDDNAASLIENTGKILVRHTYSNTSASDHKISGKLSVTGNLQAGSSVKIKGEGAIESVHYDGNGSVFGINALSAIPDGSLLSEYNWTGALNSNWNEPSNWAGGMVPAAISNVAVVASDHNPEITGKACLNNLFINSGSSLAVNPEGMININGNLSVIGIGKLLLKNTVAAKSSLFLNGDASGAIQSEYQVIKGQKNLVSSPVEMAYSKTFLNMYLRTYDESMSQWGEYIVPTNDPLKVMQGYELYSLSSETRTFEGTPDQNTKSYVISNSGNGLNLTGNPFPCYIDWENNDNNAWERSSIASAIYYPDPSGSGNFSVYLPGGDDAVKLNNGSRFIAPMQGFFVKASKQGSLVVTQNSRVSSLNEPVQTIKNNSIKFKLKDSAGLSDEVMFRVLENSTFEFDDKYDALKIQNNTDSPSLYLKSQDDEKYAVNSIPGISSSSDIPLNIEISKAGQFNLSFVGGPSFEYRYPVILEDKQLNKFIDLRLESDYSFYHSPEMNADRFEIHFYSTQAIDEQAEEMSGVTVVPGEIKVNGNDHEIYTATLFSSDGKMISTAKGSLSEGLSLTTGNRAAGVCILQLSDGKQTMTKKILTK
jgi:hypothetical protein